LYLRKDHRFDMREEEASSYEELPESAPFSVHLMAGALAGIAEHTCTYPLDFIKTRLQVLHPSPSAVYKGLLDALRTISGTEGPLQLLRGVQSVMLGAGPAHAVYFASYEQVKKMLGIGETASANPVKTGIAGAVATTLADAMMTPFDVVKQRLQIHNSSYSGVVDCFTQVFKREGLRAFYISYPTTLLLNIPFHGLQFPIYERFRQTLNPQGEYSPLTHIVAGGIAGACAGFVTTPIDNLKTTLQIRGELFKNPISLVNTAHSSTNVAMDLDGMRGAYRAILEKHGWRGFWRGAVPRTLTFMPSTAICWGVYEYFKWQLQQ
jgi:solute carrier family 25 (mitochondrial iron transporter), member 28/37